MLIKDNFEILKDRYNMVYKEIENIDTKLENYEIIGSRSGEKTIMVDFNGVRYFLHSKYNPKKEADTFIKNNIEQDIENYIVYGFGFGYHIKSLLKMSDNSKIYVFELNKDIFKLALNNIDLREILDSNRVEIILENFNKPFLNEFAKCLKMKNSKLIIHEPSLKAIPSKFVNFKYALEDYKIIKSSGERYSHVMDKNFIENIKKYNYNIDILFNKFKDIPMILVSAGPSLDKNIHLLKRIKNKVFIISVGRAVKPLLMAHIVPDMIVITDPQSFVHQQIEGINLKVPIVVLSTCDYNVMNNYDGYKFIALQKGYPKAEEYAYKNNYKLIKTGGSVATTALDIGIRMGCNPIVFVGQDLAYTDGKTHCENTSYLKITDNPFLRNVESIEGSTVYTSRNLFIYLKWIENRISEEPDITFIDATEGGAKIKGTVIMPLEDVINSIIKYKLHNFHQMIKELVIKYEKK